MSEHPPVPVLDVLAVAQDAVLGGSMGYFHIAADGYLNCTWLSKKKCYRVTLDVTPGHALDPEKAREFNEETLRNLEASS